MGRRWAGRCGSPTGSADTHTLIDTYTHIHILIFYIFYTLIHSYLTHSHAYTHTYPYSTYFTVAHILINTLIHNTQHSFTHTLIFNILYTHTTYPDIDMLIYILYTLIQT